MKTPEMPPTPTESSGTHLRVAHVVLSLECGGLEQVVADLARIGRDGGQQVSILCLERRGVLAEELEANGVPVYCLEKPPGLKIVSMWGKLRAVLAGQELDVLHSHQIGALFYAGPAGRAAGIRTIVHTEHGKHFTDRPRTRWLGRLAAWNADRYFCVSRDIADDVVRFRIAPKRKVAVVPNGIDIDRFRAADGTAVRQEFGIPAEAPVIGTVGRLAEIKRQDLLLRAFAEALTRAPSAYLLIVGEGPQRGELERLASELGLADRVRFAGYRADRERPLHAMDLFALTSRSEGMPLSVLEAWASGVPVIAAAVGGLPELIEDGRTGVLVTGDDPAGWGGRFAALLGDQDRRKRLAHSGTREALDRYSLQAMAGHYDSHYVELTEGMARKRHSDREALSRPPIATSP